MKKAFAFTKKMAAAAAVAAVCWAQMAGAQTWNSGGTTVTLSGGTLTVSPNGGTGAMANYANNQSIPWYDSRLSVTNVIIEDGVTSIGNRAFVGATNLTAVTIPNSVTSIGNIAFLNSGLTSVSIPNSVDSIGSEAFRGCVNLTSVTLHEGLLTIGNQAFFGCTRLASITIPNSVTSIGTSVFQGCTGLITAVIGNNVGSIGNHVFSGSGSLASVTIGSSVTSIGTSAFQNCSTLTSITLPEGVTSIGNDAFLGCTKLASIDIPNSVTSIGTAAFRNSGITSIVLPENLTSIANNTFNGCTDLTTVTFPPNLLSIGNMAFFNSGLTSVTIPNTVTNVGSNTFADSRKLTSVVIGSGVTELNHFHFSGCTTLVSIEAVPENPVFSSIDGVLFNKDQTTLALFPPGKQGIYAIPAGTTSSEEMAFYGCGLTAVIIPNSVTSLGGGGIFAGCNSLTSIVSLNPVPPTAGQPHGLTQSNVDVYVLPGSISAYEQAEWWRGSEWTSFKSISSAYQTVTFDSQGGSAVASQDVIIFSKAEKPAAPIRGMSEPPIVDNYTFGGWFMNADINISAPLPPIAEWDFDTDIVTGNITLYAKWTSSTSILSLDREIPIDRPNENIAVITPIIISASEFTAGPNPVAKSSGRVDFFRQGKRINDGVLTIFDASGNVVNRVQITCRGDRPRSPATPESTESANSRRIIGTWDLTDSRGRPVSEGTYLARGVLTTVDGKSERVSVVIGVR